MEVEEKNVKFLTSGNNITAPQMPALFGYNSFFFKIFFPLTVSLEITGKYLKVLEGT